MVINRSEYEDIYLYLTEIKSKIIIGKIYLQW